MSGDRGWRDRAACRGEDPELFFPVGDPESVSVVAQVALAKAVCAQCPVVAPCLEVALVAIPEGVAGGLSAEERRLLRARVSGSAAVSAGGRRPGGVDREVVASLVAGEGVVKASEVEVAWAAVELYLAGHGAGVVATRLGVGARQVYRWLERYSAGEPLVARSGRPRRESA